MPRSTVKDEFVINYLKDTTDFNHVYPDIPFERGVNVTTQQHDIITKYLKNLDKEPHLRKYNFAIKAPRRCGKTTLFTRLIPLMEKKIKLLDHDVVTGKQTEQAKMRILIAAMTFKKIKSLYWEPLLHFSKKVGLGYRPYGGEGEDIITPKGTLIHFRSLRDKNTIDLLRGEKFILSLIDEAQSVTDKVFLDLPAALKAALTDYGGTNIITGTEAKVPFGFWYDISQGNRGYEVDNLIGTATVPERRIEAAVRGAFDLTPAGIIRRFDLRRPIYRQTAVYGHFGRDRFPWERTDAAESLAAAAG